MHIENCILTNITKIRELKPVIHNITNFVVMASSANILLAIGASPVMAHCESEVEEMVSISKALVINIGTLDEYWISSMIKAVNTANRLKIPVVLDVVGAGATKLRTETAHRIMDECCQLFVLRGNASEILAMTSKNTKSKGVDSSIEINQKIIESAKKIALTKNCIVGISGEIDIITDGSYVTYVYNGHPIMTKVTGMGCGLSAFTGAFCAVENNKYHATIAAFTLYGICGDLAGKNSGNSPGSFSINFLDTIYNIDYYTLSNLIKIKSI